MDPDTSEVDLTAAEKKKLAKLEAVVSKGTSDVGRALIEIRDQKLYRASHRTFESYCRDRWALSKSQGYRQIGAVEVLTDLSPIGDKITLPQNEAQCRPLIPLSTKERRKAWAEVAEKAAGKPITARLISQVVQSVRPGLATPAKEKRKPEANTTISEALVLVDEIEQAVHAGQGREQILKLLAKLKSTLGDSPGARTENPASV